MKKSLFVFFASLFSLALGANDATMYKWQSHIAYGSVVEVVDAGDVIYGLTNGSIFSVNKITEEIQTFTKLNGLHGAEITTMAYDNQSNSLILAYKDGLIDIYHNGQFTAMTDLQQKVMTASKCANKIVIDNGIAYLCMPFGIVAVDLTAHLIKDTYYIGDNGSNVNVLGLAFASDSVYAISSSVLYSSSITANWMDYANWHRMDAPADSSYSAIAFWHNFLMVQANSTLLLRNGTKWVRPVWWNITGICPTKDKLFLPTWDNCGLYYLDAAFTPQSIASTYYPQSIVANGSTYWLATEQDGIVRQTDDGTQSFQVNGPLVNSPYCMRFGGDKLIIVPGGFITRTGLSNEAGCVMLMENDIWSGISHKELLNFTQKGDLINIYDAVIDPSDYNHFFVSGIGCGLLEFKDNQIYRWYYGGNSILDYNYEPPEYSTWVGGLIYDSQGNLWMHNLIGKRSIKVLMANGQWVVLDHVAANMMDRARDMLIWNQNEHIKIIVCSKQPGLLMLNDQGTIADQSDDECVLQTSFVDQDNNALRLEVVYSMAQDKNGALWVGTDAGLMVFDDPTTLFQSGSCRKIKIPRDDGTGLADYLLETERINSIVVDGANRKWIGTQSSGVYLVSEDGLETIYHFTSDNSPLADNAIMSLAIQPSTGRVFIGTSKGLMSFQSDASPAAEEYTSSGVYAYPNPVRPDFEGVITIRGLMDETVVHILDNAGNLVCETRSNGGLAVWDGKTADGRRAASGVYTVFLNENTDNKNAVTKILLLH